MFGGNTFGSGAAFGASAGKSSQSKRPFGAPDDDDQSDDDDDGSDDEDDEKHNREVKGDDGTIKPLGLKEQEGLCRLFFWYNACKISLVLGVNLENVV
jgi:hypothetical protein